MCQFRESGRHRAGRLFEDADQVRVPFHGRVGRRRPVPGHCRDSRLGDAPDHQTTTGERRSFRAADIGGGDDGVDIGGDVELSGTIPGLTSVDSFVWWENWDADADIDGLYFQAGFRGEKNHRIFYQDISDDVTIQAVAEVYLKGNCFTEERLSEAPFYSASFILGKPAFIV